MGIGISTRSKECLRRQGANSASTANVTRTFMAIVQMLVPVSGATRTKQRALQRGCRLGYAPGAAGVDVTVRFVPADGALQRRFHPAGTETQFALGSRAIDKHFVPCDFHALDRNLRLAS